MSQTSEKQFDAVHMMRRVRDELSRELANMSHEEQSRYIREQLATKPLIRVPSRGKPASEMVIEDRR